MEDALQELSEGLLLAVVQFNKETLVDGAGNRFGRFKSLPSGFGCDDEAAAAVVGIRLAADEAAAFEVVDDRNDCAGVKSEEVAEVALGAVGRCRRDRQDGVVAASKGVGLERAVEIADRAPGRPGQQESDLVGNLRGAGLGGPVMAGGRCRVDGSSFLSMAGLREGYFTGTLD